MKAMILAAGRGERMRPLTDAMPKPLLPVGGRPLIDYHIDALRAAGVHDFVVNLAWLGEQIENHLGDGHERDVSIAYSHEPEGALETGGGVFRALPLLGEQPFWLSNGDVYCDYSYTVAALAADDLAHLVLVPNPQHNPAGDFALDNARIANTGATMHTYSGIAILRRELFSSQQDDVFPLAPLLRAAADAGRVSGELYTGYWSDVGTPERLAETDQRLNG